MMETTRTPPQSRKVHRAVVESTAEALKELFAEVGVDIFKLPDIRRTLAWHDEDGFSVVSTLIISGDHPLQMALAADPEVLALKNGSGTSMSTILMHSGDNAVRERVLETQRRGTLRE